MPYAAAVASRRAKGATMSGYRFRLFCLAGLLAPCSQRSLAPAAAADANDPWPGLVQDIFDNRPMNDGADVIAIEMPYRAEDAAIVPVTLRTMLPPGDSRRVLRITLVIDQNPAPMAAKFELGPDAKVSEISTRVRVNNYTDVHAVAELSDGKLYMAKTYVKASGGCSAPAAKNADEARSRLGQMRYRQFARARPGSGQRRSRGPDHDRPSQQFRPADGPGHAALRSRLLRQPIAAVAGRQPGAGDGRRNLDFGRSQYPVHLCFQWREARSAPRPGTPTATCSGTNGRSTTPAFEA